MRLRLQLIFVFLAVGCGSDEKSPATGGICSAVEDCPEIICSCNDGTKESAGKTCFGERCEAQDVCVRLHHCGGHGGAVGAEDESVVCERVEECLPAYCYCVPVLGLTELRTCTNGFCTYDEACTTPPSC